MTNKLTPRAALTILKGDFRYVDFDYRAEGLSESDLFTMACNISYEALEKEIPQPPYKHEEDYYTCPECDCEVSIDVNSKIIGLSYCLHCGQKIDWSDINSAPMGREKE